MKEIRWGIVAPGHIAHKFAAAMTVVEGSRIESVASRDIRRARDFAGRFSIPRVSPSYADLNADPNIDALYVALPNSLHMDASIPALERGKAVLCEKPLACSAAEGRRMVSAARSGGGFLMEALWTRFLPAFSQAQKVVLAGEIGELRRIEADYSFDIPESADHRLNRQDLGGGTLLDTGVYVLHAAAAFAGMSPDQIQALGRFSESTVDDEVLIQLSYPSMLLAQLSCAIRTEGRRDLRVIGDRGVLEIPAPFIAAQMAVIRSETGERRINEPFDKNGFEYQIREANRCIRRGLTESPRLPLDQSLGVLELIDDVRVQLGGRNAK